MLDEQRKKVLVIEDDPNRRQLYYRALELANYWVLEANRLRDSDRTGQDDDEKVLSVMHQIGRHFFHAAVIDLSLIKEDAQNRAGQEALTVINNYKEGTKCIVISQYGKDEDVREAWRVRGAYDYLPKRTYSRETFLVLVESAVKEAELRINAMLTKFSYYILVDVSARTQAQEKLKSGGSEEIRSIVDEALRHYFPYDLQCKSATFESICIGDVQHCLLLIKLWSRYLGGALELRVGSREACQFRQIALVAGGKKSGVDFKVCEIDPRDKLVGLVEYLSSATIEEFASVQPEQDEE